MATTKEEQSTQEESSKVFGYVVGRRAEDQEHPDKKEQE